MMADSKPAFKTRKFTTSKQVEQHFAWLRSKTFEGYQDLLKLDGGGLSRLLLAGEITGFQLCTMGPEVERQIKGKKFRLMMLDQDERRCKAELNRKGVTFYA